MAWTVFLVSIPSASLLKTSSIFGQLFMRCASLWVILLVKERGKNVHPNRSDGGSDLLYICSDLGAVCFLHARCTCHCYCGLRGINHSRRTRIEVADEQKKKYISATLRTPHGLFYADGCIINKGEPVKFGASTFDGCAVLADNRGRVPVGGHTEGSDTLCCADKRR